MKSTTDFCCLATILCTNCIWDSHDLVKALEDCLLNIVQGFKNSKEHMILNIRCIYKNEPEKVCFAHDAAYTNSKDLAWQNLSNKIFKNRACTKS